MPRQQEFLELLYQALHGSRRGIAVSTQSPKAATVNFHKAIRESKDPELLGLAIHVSPFHPDSELWLVKRIGDHKDAHRDQPGPLDGEPGGPLLDIDL